jgi:hypothetical protein
VVVAHRPALIRRAKTIYEVGGCKIVAHSGWCPLHTLQPATSAQ